MLQYISAGKYKHINKLINLWNSEFSSTFPIKPQLYKEKILEDGNFNKEASFIALYDNEAVGFIFIKTWLKDTGFANETEAAHISLIFVKKEMRNMGIGSDMLQLAVDEIKKHTTIKKIIVGNEINNIFTGVPNELINAPIFFMNKGFVQKECVVDMIRVVRQETVEDIDTKELSIRIATEDEKDEMLKLCLKNNWNREAYHINGYFDNGGTGRRIAIGLVNGKIVAITRFNDANKLPMKTNTFMRDRILGSILFTKIDSDFENKGYDVYMSKVTKNYLMKRGCKKIVILGTKRIQFYKSLGYSAFKYYLQFEEDI